PWPACGSSVSRSARPSTRTCALTAISARPARRFRRSWSRRERTWRWRARCVASCRRVTIRKRSFPEYGNKTIDRQSEGRIEAGRGAQERTVDDSGPVERPAADGKPASRPADARRRDEASAAVVEDRCNVVCRRDGDRGRTWVFLRPPARQLAPPPGLRQGDGHAPRHAGGERTFDGPGRPYRKPDAELVRGEKVNVAMTLGVARLRIEPWNLVRLHLVRLVERLWPKFREVREWLRSAGRMRFGKATSQAARGA